MIAATGRRFAVPAALLALAVVLAAVVIGLRWDRIGGGEPVTAGAGGVATELADGADYDVYADADAVATDPGSVCVLSPRDGSQADQVPLRDDGPGGDRVTRDGTTWVQVGTFTSTVGGPATVSCIAAADGILLQPGSAPWLPLPALLAVLALLAAAAATLVLTLRRRP